MLNAARSEARRALSVFALALATLTLWRWAGLALTPAQLFVDEAQYWLWGQTIEWGYYSKPPLIGWVIRAATGMAGSDAPFWVRAPGPLFHAVTAVVITATAWRFARPWAAVAAGLAYATMPAVAVGSFMISTDTILMPFFAASIGLWLILIRRGSSWLALGLGICLGLGMLAKYAAIYFIPCALIAAALYPAARMRPRDAVIAFAAFVVVISPNIWWNLTHGLSTLDHTLDNVDWVRDPGGRRGVNLDSLAEFLGGQFAVFGPILFSALIWLVLRPSRAAAPRALIAMSVPVIALVCVQALLSRAYANWAAPAYVAATLLVVPTLAERARGWLWASFAVNGILALALPLLLLVADGLSLDGKRLVAERYLGRAELSGVILEHARQVGAPAIVASSRDVLADLFYRRAPGDPPVYAVPPRGKPHNHYAMNHALPAGASGEVLFVATSIPEGCEARVVARERPQRGAHRGVGFVVAIVPAACLLPG